MKRLLFSLLAVSLLTSCGLKGNLVLPDAHANLLNSTATPLYAIFNK